MANEKVNKVIYGNDTLIDLTGDTVTSATLLNGTTAHDASGASITGSYTPATPTSITPSNASPVALTANTPVNPTTAGYAIASYNTKTPSNSTPVSLTSGEIDKMGGNDYAIASYSTVTPSGNPTSVSSGDIVKIDGGYDDVIVDMDMMVDIRGSNTYPDRLYEGSLAKIAGNTAGIVKCYAIESYTPVTPSSTPTSISAGDRVQVKGSGVIVDAGTSITPSHSSPGSLSSGSIYKTGGSGYAIESYDEVTPSLTNRDYTSVSANDIDKINTRTGYVYGAKPTGRYLFSYTRVASRDSTGWTNFPITSATSTVYDPNGTSTATMLDEQFAHFADGGQIIVDRAIPHAYLAGVAWYGRSNTGTIVYSGIRFLKNGTVITGASVYGSSSDSSPTFRRIETSFEVGDVIQVQMRVSSTSGSGVLCIISGNICTD